MLIQKKCPMCGRIHMMWLREAETVCHAAWSLGLSSVQEAFPEMNPAEREFVKSGYCIPCQELLFGSSCGSGRIAEERPCPVEQAVDAAVFAEIFPEARRSDAVAYFSMEENGEELEDVKETVRSTVIPDIVLMASEYERVCEGTESSSHRRDELAERLLCGPDSFFEEYEKKLAQAESETARNLLSELICMKKNNI